MTAAEERQDTLRTAYRWWSARLPWRLLPRSLRWRAFDRWGRGFAEDLARDRAAGRMSSRPEYVRELAETARQMAALRRAARGLPLR